MFNASTLLLVLLWGSQVDAPRYEIAIPAGLEQGTGIYRMHSDGSPSRFVSRRSGMLFPGSWSPDGSKIFCFGCPEGMYVVNADGTGDERLPLPASWLEPFFAWSPDSTRLTFSSGFEDPRFSDPGFWDRADHGHEVWSTAVYVMDVRTKQFRRLTPLGQNRFASWSPDGRRIVYSGTEPGGVKSDIYVVDATDGSAPIRIVSAPTVNVQPAWSPKGDQIAFIAAPMGGAPSPKSGVFVVKPDGTGARRISPDFGSTLAWSPDGRFLLISRYGPDRIVDVTTGATVELTTGMMGETFTPDGKSVIYHTQYKGPGTAAIYAIDVDGKNQRKLIDDQHTFAVSPLLKR